MFLMISGYLMFSQGYQLKDKAVFSSRVLNRFIKLLIPVIPICIIVFLLKNIGNGIVFYNDEVGGEIYSWWLRSGYDTSVTLKNLILSPFTIFFKGDGLFNNAFWMLDDLLISSLAVFVVAFSFQEVKNKKIIKYAFICFAAMIFSPYYLPTFLGGFLYLVLSDDKINKIKIKNKKLVHFVAIVIFIVGIVASGYPSGRAPTNFYRIFEQNSLFKGYLSAVEFYHVVGAFLILLVLLNSKKIQKILEHKTLNIFGKNSYAIYLIHVPIIYILSPYVFKLFMNMTEKYLISASVTILFTCIVVVVLSHYYTKFTSWLKTIFDKYVNKLNF